MGTPKFLASWSEVWVAWELWGRVSCGGLCPQPVKSVLAPQLHWVRTALQSVSILQAYLGRDKVDNHRWHTKSTNFGVTQAQAVNPVLTCTSSRMTSSPSHSLLPAVPCPCPMKLQTVPSFQPSATIYDVCILQSVAGALELTQSPLLKKLLFRGWEEESSLSGGCPRVGWEISLKEKTWRFDMISPWRLLHQPWLSLTLHCLFSHIYKASHANGGSSKTSPPPTAHNLSLMSSIFLSLWINHF